MTTPTTGQPAQPRARHEPDPIPYALCGDTIHYPPRPGRHRDPIRVYHTVTGGRPDDHHQGAGLTADRVISRVVQALGGPQGVVRPDEPPLDAAVWEGDYLAAVVRFFSDGAHRVLELGIDGWPFEAGDDYGETDLEAPAAADPIADAGAALDARLSDSADHFADARNMVPDPAESARQTLAGAGTDHVAGVGKMIPTDDQLIAAACWLDNWSYLTRLVRDDLTAALEAGDHATARRLVDRELDEAVDQSRDAERVLVKLLERRPDVIIRVGRRWFHGDKVRADARRVALEVVPHLVPVAAAAPRGVSS